LKMAGLKRNNDAMPRLAPLLCPLLVLLAACSADKAQNMILHTSKGDIHIALSGRAPEHCNDFIAMLQMPRRDSLTFYRVERDFAIHFGVGPADSLAHTGVVEYEAGELPLGGSLASVVEQPGKLSESGNYFLILDRPQSDASLDALEKKTGRRFSPTERQAYKKHGGLPQLQGQVTVFGRITEGLEIAQRIAALPRDAKGRPLERVAVWE